MGSPSYALSSPLPFELPFDPASSILATRTAWAIDRLVRWDLTPELATTHMRCSTLRPAHVLADLMGVVATQLSVVSSYREDGLISYCDALDVRGRPRQFRCVIAEEAPHLIRTFSAMHVAPEGVTVRRAGPADSRAMRALERQTPVIDGDVPVTYDRGDDYLAGTRLMEDVDVIVAESDGEIIAEHCDAYYEGQVGGERIPFGYRHHTRIGPEFQRLKVWPAVNFESGEKMYRLPDDRAEQSLIRVGNERMREFVSKGTLNVWLDEVELCLIDTAAAAGAPVGRVARPPDADRIAHLSNAAHGAEQLYVPYSVDTFTQRVSRDTALYGWDDILITEDAFVGVWEQRLGVTVGDATPQVRAIVLDSGFAPGEGGHELERLVRAWCARLRDRGTTHLAALTSTSSPDRDVLHGLAATIDRFLHVTRAREPQPPSGIRFDAIYF